MTVKPGDDFIVEALDWTGGQIKNDDNAADIRDCYLPPCHHLVGPIEVTGAEPGDILIVDILDIGPLKGNEWGYTGIFATDNGGGFLTDLFPEPRKAIWDCKGIYASSRHIPKVASPPSPIPASSAARRAMSFWRSGTSASAS